MTLTKSDAAERVRRGQSVETFHHATMGVFDITATRLLIRAKPDVFKIHRVKFADIKAEGRSDLVGSGVVNWLIGQREVDAARCAELTREQLKDPLINMMDFDGMSYIIDGIHRLAERHRRGKRGYSFYLVPIFMVPKLTPGTYLERPWGEMDVRDGKLVRRES